MLIFLSTYVRSEWSRELPVQGQPLAETEAPCLWRRFPLERVFHPSERNKWAAYFRSRWHSYFAFSLVQRRCRPSVTLICWNCSLQFDLQEDSLVWQDFWDSPETLREPSRLFRSFPAPEIVPTSWRRLRSYLKNWCFDNDVLSVRRDSRRRGTIVTLVSSILFRSNRSLLLARPRIRFAQKTRGWKNLWASLPGLGISPRFLESLRIAVFSFDA